MHEYDVALKVLLQASTDLLLRQLTGVSVARWLNVEIPEVSSSRADLLGAAADGTLVHIELQSTNDPDMALRMAEYSLRIYRRFKKFPKQIVLYVGEAKLRMNARLTGPDSAFQYTLIDARELDGAQLLASERIEDNLIAILTKLEDRTVAIRNILERIAGLEKSARRDALAQFLIISGMRTLEETIKEEALKMPILNDIMDHKVLGPAILQGRREGRQEGLQEGLQEGRHAILRRILEKRFGQIPEWVEKRLTGLPAADLDEVGVRILDASTFEDLFPQKQ
jgi:predicted transposase/invertase (TIGR01784 family)